MQVCTAPSPGSEVTLHYIMDVTWKPYMNLEDKMGIPRWIKKSDVGYPMKFVRWLIDQACQHKRNIYLVDKN